MNSYIFDKKINLAEVPEKVNNVLLENSFDYVRLTNGIHVMGKISISGDCKCNEHNVPFVDTLDVDLIIPNDNIGSLKGLKLVVDDYETHIVDESINFRIRCTLNGYDEAQENFEIDKSFKEAIERLEGFETEQLVNEFRDTITPEDEKMMEGLINGDVDVIVTDSSDNHKMPQYEEENDKKEEEEQKDDAVYPYLDVEEDATPLELQTSNNDEVIENKMSEAKKDAEVIREEKPQSKNDLFEHERFIVFSRFYRVKYGETYASIANDNNVDENKLREINKNKELIEGSLVQIPR